VPAHFSAFRGRSRHMIGSSLARSERRCESRIDKNYVKPCCNNLKNPYSYSSRFP
jgi:hypothetical protein